ncbi:hypothetical protein ACWEJ6_40820 [Nonomuraea sp. NPDC004702]
MIIASPAPRPTVTSPKASTSWQLKHLIHARLWTAHADGLAYVILDGPLIATDRRAAPIISVKGELIDAWYSGEAHQHAVNPRALSAPSGLPLRITQVEPGSATI